MIIARPVQLTDPAAVRQGIDQQLLLQPFRLFALELPFQEVASGGSGDQLGAIVRVGEQVELFTDSVPFRVTPLGPDFNFPEHRAPSWPGPAGYRDSPCRRLPAPRGSGSGGYTVDSKHPVPRPGSERRCRSRATGRRP